MRLQFTLLFHLHHETEAEKSSQQAYHEVLSLIRQADALPIERAWLAEHHLLPTRGRLPAPLLMAVAAAGETRRIGVGPCVLVLPLHHPLDLAEHVATADLLTHGRLAVGVGSGGDPDEFAAFGVPLAERRSRFVEGLEILSEVLSGEAFRYVGAHYTIPEVTLVPRPSQAARDLLWIAAGSVDSASVAGHSGGHLLLARGVAVPDLQQQIAAYGEARLSAGHGGTPQIQVTRGVYVAQSEDDAWRDAAEGIRRHYERLKRFGGQQVDLREMAQRGDFIIGTPEQCAKQIEALCQHVPVTHLACDVSLIGMSHALVARSLDLLGHEVIPRVRQVTDA